MAIYSFNWQLFLSFLVGGIFRSFLLILGAWLNASLQEGLPRGDFQPVIPGAYN
jgi:hypothetical protein